jgi:hypothetical protein
MSETYEHAELLKFHQSIVQDVRTLQVSDDEGATQEQLFTRKALDFLTEAGETENARPAYHEGQLGTRNQHKINAYAEPDNYETVDLFGTIYKGSDDPQRIPKDEIETAIKRISNFFKKARSREYVNEIEEASEIFDFAHTLANSSVLKENLVRINAIIFTDGVYSGDYTQNDTISGIPIFYRVVDIVYLHNISQKSHVPIEIDFKKEGYEIPCIISPSGNTEYQSYLAIIPGGVLASIYERFGSRLLEQNVRSFLQFTGKINKGIRNTIIKEPHMFLAFNNGIAATAEDIEIENSESGSGFIISKVKDFQIVNGGQTTASIYHTHKKDKADVSGVFVQVKLSVVKNRDNFSEIVSRISEYANTQNKVSISDLSSNKPFHIELEKLSRGIFAPFVPGKTSHQTKWFYERARGQYKNARAKEGFTPARAKAFDSKKPPKQVFTKEELAKFLNSYKEVYDGNKLTIGPHWVVKGNQKNYAQFVAVNVPKKIDNVYFEDLIAKAILFKAAENIYGVKPNSIGDMRYVTVPYAISYLGFVTDYRLDLFKIWKNQAISPELTNLLLELLRQIEGFIKANAPGSLYGEWAKSEECWLAVKRHDFKIDLKKIEHDLASELNSSKRLKRRVEDIDDDIKNEEMKLVKSIPYEIWKKVEGWGVVSGHLSAQLRNFAFTLAGRIRQNQGISDVERKAGLQIIEIVNAKAPELLFDADNFTKEISLESEGLVSLETIQRLVVWDKEHRRLKPYQFTFMRDLGKGLIPLDERNSKLATVNVKFARRFGFES